MGKANDNHHANMGGRRKTTRKCPISGHRRAGYFDWVATLKQSMMRETGQHRVQKKRSQQKRTEQREHEGAREARHEKSVDTRKCRGKRPDHQCKWASESHYKRKQRCRGRDSEDASTNHIDTSSEDNASRQDSLRHKHKYAHRQRCVQLPRVTP